MTVKRSHYGVPFLTVFWLACAPAAPATNAPAGSLARDYVHVFTRASAQSPEYRRRLGPFFEHVRWDDGRGFFAVRPLLAHTTERDGARRHADALWPLASWRTDGTMRSARCLSAFFQDHDRADPVSRSRLWVLPFYFSGRSHDGRPYWAVFPAGGRIRDFFGREDVRFFMFPLYADSRGGEVETLHVLWPLFSATRGGGVARWRLFPFYGHAIERDGTRRRFVLWPIWSSVRRDAHASDPGGGFVLFPLFGVVRSEKQRAVMALPPFFRFAETPRGRESLFPWPFLQHSTGEIEKTYIWPLWGRKRAGPVESAFFLWPLGRLGRQDRDDHVAVQRSFYPLYYSRRIDLPEADAAASEHPFALTGRPLRRYEKIWPLYSYQRDENTAVLRVPDLWPGRPFAPVERNYAPFWTLYSRSRGPAGREQELLWGLFRRRVSADGDRRTRVFPLFESESRAGGGRRSLALLGGMLRVERREDRQRISFFGRGRPTKSGETPP